MRVLNVGSGGSRVIPETYKGWDQDTLDIDAAVHPDIVCDAKHLTTLKAASYDAVFCSHNLEHFYKHDVPSVLQGFLYVLKRDGFAHISVPDMTAVVKAMVESGKDIDDTWYRCGGGPISFHDVIYGWGKQVSSGNVYYSHKTGFTEKSLGKALRTVGFHSVMTATDGGGNLHAFAFKTKPRQTTLRQLGI